MTHASPSQPDLDARYAAAKRVALAAAQRGMEFYRQRESLTVDHKGDDPQDVVSIADKSLEAFIRAEFSREFPEDGFIGEEEGTTDLDARCIWVIDPIDGTRCFVNGLHNWCVSIGLLVDGEPALGVIADPNHNELFHGRIGHGAFVDGKPLKVHKSRDVRDGVMGVGTTHRPGKENFIPFLQKLLDAGGMFFRNGSGALMTAYVAAGRLIAYYETKIHSWDCLAGLVMLKEAGGVANDFFADNGVLDGNPLLVACPGVYRQVAEMIGPSIKSLPQS